MRRTHEKDEGRAPLSPPDPGGSDGPGRSRIERQIQPEQFVASMGSGQVAELHVKGTAGMPPWDDGRSRGCHEG